MLILIITLIMCCVKTNSTCLDFCDCSEVLPNKTLFSTLTNNQESLFSLITTENGSTVSFPDSSTIILQIYGTNYNFTGFNLSWIEHLVISENNITTVPEFISVFKSVEVLDLSRNEIEYIEENSFRTLNLNLLNVSKNSIASLSNISSGLDSLKNLDVSHNIVENIDYIIDLPNLQYLNLSTNNLKALNSEVLINLKLLQHLDVSRNRLVSISPIQLQNLIHFFIADNYYLGESRDIFFLGRKIQTLDASRTGLQQVPAILTHSIQYLILKKNLIRNINSGDFDSYPLLNLLDATSNNIKFIEDDSLGRLEFLSFLYLTDNQLEEIPRRLPEKLKVLHLDTNKIGTIRKKDLTGLSELKVLFLNDNNVSVIKEGAFFDLISLIKLDLSRNPIIDLKTGLFAGPLSLEVLNLASVKIKSLNDIPFPFSAPENLVTLNLSSSPGLVNQFLSDTATLMAAKRLQELDLTGGNLKFIRKDLQFFLPQLESLHITGNELNSSQINWLKSWLCAQAKNDGVDNSTISTRFNYEFSNVSTLKVSEYGLTRKNMNGDDFQVNEVSKFSQALFSPYKKYPGSNQDENEILKVVDRHEDVSKHSDELTVCENGKKYVYYTVFYVILIGLFGCFFFALYNKISKRVVRIDIDDSEVTHLPTISDIW